ncbi:MAG: type IV pili methyl-accepting chemotaxis transducer N-terminal domain-containing protein [Deltaproteobacteria bacterium]|nr:type IV pili methyl-accepting chemotaxis transducer N-terminal domain-containing protein [Deltaproteobacteria bacterium]
MDLHSVKSRFLGSYLFLIILFFIQLPIIYMLVGGMSQKYSQVVEASALRKRAVELNYVLNRHIMNGEEELEQVFQDRKAEYGKAIESLRTGTPEVPAVTGSAKDKLAVVEQKWQGMLAALDKTMESGDSLTDAMRELEVSTYPMVDKMNGIVKGFVALGDQSYSKSIDLAGLQRMRTVNMAYLMERYARSNFELDLVSDNLKKTMSDFETTLKGLKNGSVELGLKPVHNPELIRKFSEAEELWAKRKELVAAGMKDKDVFAANVNELSNRHTPEIVAAADDLTKEIAAGARSSAMKGIVVMAVAVFVSAGLSVFFMWSTNIHIIKPIMKVKDTVEAFSHGDLSKRAEIKIRFLGKDLKDEVTSLGDSVDAMAVQMSGVIGRITDSSNLLASASEQLSSSATQIEEGANRQSGQTVQVATSMEEMNATVIEVAKNSNQVSESARNAQSIAVKGGDIVSEAISAMQEVAESTSVTADTIKKLGKSSEEIGSIVSVINDIADQTNLLALNAAIEAARAGDQGRGFAVVADEVRKLAERTTKATKEISGMIKTIQTETGTAVSAMDEGTRKVENGVRLANEAGDALKRIVTGVEGVTDMISHIATSAEEQSATTDEITQNMDSIAEVAKTNVAAIGEVSRATNEMARLATELKSLVSNFKVEHASERRPAETSGAGGFRKTAEVKQFPRFKKASGQA